MKRLLLPLFIALVLAQPASAERHERRDTVQKEVVHHAKAVAIASKYLGTNPTKMARLWCANFIGMIEKKVGRKGTGSNWARSYLDYGKKVSLRDTRSGDLVILSRGKKGGHVGYFVGWAKNGNAILVSGNAGGGKVRKSEYARSRILGVRRP